MAQTSRRAILTTVSVQFQNPSNATINFTPATIYPGASTDMRQSLLTQVLLAAFGSGSVIGVGNGPITYDVTGQHFVDLRHHRPRSISISIRACCTTQFAQLQILSFTSDGTLAGSPFPGGTGDVSGQLPATLTFDNGSGLQRLLRQLSPTPHDFFPVSLTDSAPSVRRMEFVIRSDVQTVLA